MTASRDELHHLIDELPDDQVPVVAEELRRRRRSKQSSTYEPFSWIAMGPSKHAGTDDARRVDEILAGELGRS